MHCRPGHRRLVAILEDESSTALKFGCRCGPYCCCGCLGHRFEHGIGAALLVYEPDGTLQLLTMVPLQACQRRPRENCVGDDAILAPPARRFLREENIRRLRFAVRRAPGMVPSPPLQVIEPDRIALVRSGTDDDDARVAMRHTVVEELGQEKMAEVIRGEADFEAVG